MHLTEGADNAESEAQNGTGTEIRNPGYEGLEMISEGLSEQRQAEHAEELAGDAEKLFVRIERRRKAQWADYMELAAILHDIAETALHLSGANNREGFRYNTTMSRLLAGRAPKLGTDKLRVFRNCLINIHEHRAVIEDWRKTWTVSQQQLWLSPITVWRKYKALFIDAPAETKRTRESDQQKDDYVRNASEALERKNLENRRLRMNALLDCDVKEIAMLIWEACDAEQIAELVELLQQDRPQSEDDGWPLVVRADGTDSDADDAEEAE
jgi:hypothetical protein